MQSMPEPPAVMGWGLGGNLPKNVRSMAACPDQKPEEEPPAAMQESLRRNCSKMSTALESDRADSAEASLPMVKTRRTPIHSGPARGGQHSLPCKTAMRTGLYKKEKGGLTTVWTVIRKHQLPKTTQPASLAGDYVYLTGTIYTARGYGKYI